MLTLLAVSSVLRCLANKPVVLGELWISVLVLEELWISKSVLE